MQWPHQRPHIDALLLSMFTPSEDRPTPNNQKGAVTDQEQNRLSSGKAGEDREAASLRNW